MIFVNFSVIPVISGVSGNSGESAWPVCEIKDIVIFHNVVIAYIILRQKYFGGVLRNIPQLDIRPCLASTVAVKRLTNIVNFVAL